jgi:type I restriction enzyme S subunit
MYLESIIANFEVISNSKEGIKRLRELILNLALRGALSSSLNQSIKIKEKQVEHLPSNWRLVKIEEVSDFVNGFAFRSDEYISAGVGVVRMSDLKNKEIIPDDMKFVSFDRLKSLDEAFQVKPNEIVMGMTGATLGKPCINRTSQTFLLNQRIGKFVPKGIDSNYFFLTLANLENTFMKLSFGTGVNNLSTRQIKETLIPFPSEIEQIEIVKVVEELFTICDKLETNLGMSLGYARSASRSAISAISFAQSPKEFQLAWTRILNNWDLISEAPEGVEMLRSLILELEMKNFLSSNLEENWKITNWTTAPLKDVCEYIQRGKSPKYATTGLCKVVSQKCVRWTGFDPAPARFIDDNSLSKYSNDRFLKDGDLLWNSTGTGTVGRTANFYSGGSEKKYVADSHVTVLRTSKLDHEFLYYWSRSPDVQSKVLGSTTGSTNQQELNLGTLKELTISFPSLAEQKIKVERIKALFAICDQLESEAIKAAELAKKFARSVVSILA